MLEAVTPASLPGYTTAGTISVASGAILAVQVNTSGTGGFSSGQLDQVLGNTTWANNTSVLGIDTTQGNFTYGSNITQAVGLKKMGANTLVLTGNNTYTGATTVNSGTLQIGNGANGAWNAATSGVSIAGGAALALNLPLATTVLAAHQRQRAGRPKRTRRCNPLRIEYLHRRRESQWRPVGCRPGRHHQRQRHDLQYRLGQRRLRPVRGHHHTARQHGPGAWPGGHEGRSVLDSSAGPK